MATKHHPVWIGDGLHQFEDDCIEENEARLLKEATAELPRCFDWRVKDAVGELRALSGRNGC